MKASELWKHSDCVCFDVDSTICKEEGIDLLANYCCNNAQKQKILAITQEAMNGHMNFREALTKRLDIIKPSLSTIQDINKNYPLHLNDGVEELISLCRPSKDIYLISGGFRQMIDPIAKILNINEDNVIANNLLFDCDGNYSGFDQDAPTSQTSGKAKAIQSIIDKKGYKTVVMIGDGVTDLEAKPPAKLFIGYGGVVVREKVKKQADWFISSFKELINC